MQIVMNYKKDIQDLLTRTFECLKCEETPEQADKFEILLHYLQTGMLPSYVATGVGESESNIITSLIEACRQECRQVMEYLLTILESEEVYFRLLQLMPHEELKCIIKGISETHSRKLGEDLMKCIDLLLNVEGMGTGETPMDNISKAIPSPLRGEGQGEGELWRTSNKNIRLRIAAMLFSETLKWKGNCPIPDLFQLAMDYLPDKKLDK